MKFPSMLRSRAAAVATGALMIGLAASGGAAVAASLVTSRDIQDNTIKSVDLKDGHAVKGRDLTSGLLSRINKPGPQGPIGPQGPQGPTGPSGDSHNVYVTDFAALFAPHAGGDAAGLNLTGEGAQFGPFADGGACSTAGQDYARLVFNGLNGKPLSAVNQLDYTGMMLASNDTGGVGSLTMRITLNGGADRLTFSPNTQYNTPADYAVKQGEMHTWVTTMGTWRLNDDAGDTPAGELPFSHWASISQNGNDPIDHIDVLLGCEAGTDLQGVVRSVQANGTNYVLGKIG